MIVLARGSITEPDKLGPFMDDEKRVREQLKEDGVIKAAYRRAAGPGACSIDAIRARVETLPLVVAGLMTFKYDEIYAI